MLEGADPTQGGFSTCQHRGSTTRSFGSGRSGWGRGADHDPPQRVEQPGAGLDRTGAGNTQGADYLNCSGLGLRDCGRGLAQDGSGDLFGVEAVGLAVPVPGQPVGPVDLYDPLAGLGQCPSQGGTERAGAFHFDRPDRAVFAHPDQQPLVAGSVAGNSWEPSRRPCWLTAADDTQRFGCHAGIRSSVRADLTDWANRPGGATSL